MLACTSALALHGCCGSAHSILQPAPTPATLPQTQTRARAGAHAYPSPTVHVRKWGGGGAGALALLENASPPFPHLHTPSPPPSSHNCPAHPPHPPLQVNFSRHIQPSSASATAEVGLTPTAAARGEGPRGPRSALSPSTAARLHLCITALLHSHCPQGRARHSLANFALLVWCAQELARQGAAGYQSVYRINDRHVSWDAYCQRLGTFGIRVKVRNFLVFQVRGWLLRGACGCWPGGRGWLCVGRVGVGWGGGGGRGGVLWASRRCAASTIAT